jgi:hypothetical protein
LIKSKDFANIFPRHDTRCTEVIVEAVNKIVRIAIENGRLEGRVNKLFKYFPPDKKTDSERYPNIVSVRCTVERKSCHYMGKFIVREISRIPKPYIWESKKLGEPTVLIIGPKQFLGGIKEELKGKYGYVLEEERPEDDVIDILDGYKSIAKNPKSRLGWRILLECDRCNDFNKIIKKAILEVGDIYNFIPSKQYISKHKEIANLVKKIISAETLNLFEQKTVEDALNLSFNEIISKLRVDMEPECQTKKYLQENTNDTSDILCTSFEGSKGLAAQYVFIVGVNENHFPQRVPPSNRGICKLIVALTRTRKKCYMISCNNFGGKWLNPSIFSGWLKEQLSKEIYVNLNYIKKLCS